MEGSGIARGNGAGRPRARLPATIEHVLCVVVAAGSAGCLVHVEHETLLASSLAADSRTLGRLRELAGRVVLSQVEATTTRTLVAA